MITNLNKIKTYLKNKNICLLGNARSILNNKKNIDKYDVVCRMNRGVSKGREKYIGSRTDILFISTKFNNYYLHNFKPKYVIWMTESQGLASEWIRKNAIQNPPEDWQKLKSEFPPGILPSTGILSIYFLLKYINFKSLTIYGFDFFKSGTWYHHLRNSPWHEKNTEKQLILTWINVNKNPIKIIIEYDKTKNQVIEIPKRRRKK